MIVIARACGSRNANGILAGLGNIAILEHLGSIHIDCADYSHGINAKQMPFPVLSVAFGIGCHQMFACLGLYDCNMVIVRILPVSPISVNLHAVVAASIEVQSFTVFTHAVTSSVKRHTNAISAAEIIVVLGVSRVKVQGEEEAVVAARLTKPQRAAPPLLLGEDIPLVFLVVIGVPQMVRALSVWD